MKFHGNRELTEYCTQNGKKKLNSIYQYMSHALRNLFWLFLSLSALLFRDARSLKITVISNEKEIISLAEKQAKEKHTLLNQQGDVVFQQLFRRVI